jgi:hypothetical protein
MERRTFVRGACIVATSVGLAGCTLGPGRADDETETPASEGDAVETIARDVPSDEEDVVQTPQDVDTVESDFIDLDGVRFQRAGEKGIAVSGDAENAADRTFEDFYVEVTLYDQNEAEDELLDSTSEQEDHDEFEPGETWQWAVTFGDEPLPNIDYYTVTGVGWFD